MWKKSDAGLLHQPAQVSSLSSATTMKVLCQSTLFCRGALGASLQYPFVHTQAEKLAGSLGPVCPVVNLQHNTESKLLSVWSEICHT